MFKNLKMNIDEIGSFATIKEIYNDLSLFIDEDFFIAGGCFTSLLDNRAIKDIDIFSPNPKNVIKALRDDELSEETYSNSQVVHFQRKNVRLEVIKKMKYDSAKDVIDAFDFTIVKAAYDGEKLIFHNRFFIDNAQKRIVVGNDNLDYPVSALWRTMKYSRKGYLMCPKGLMNLMRQIENQNIDWDNPKENLIEFYPDGTPKFEGID